jgi:hypothetical protein
MRIDSGFDHLGRRCVDLTEAESWVDFERVVFELVRAKRGRISKRTDGPDARVWDIEMESARIVVSYDDLLGTRVHFEADCSDEIAKEISELLSLMNNRMPRKPLEKLLFNCWRLFQWIRP